MLRTVTPQELSKSFYLFEFPIQLVPYGAPPTMAMMQNPFLYKTFQDVQAAVNEFRMACQQDQRTILLKCFNPKLPPAPALPFAPPVSAPAPLAGGNNFIQPPVAGHAAAGAPAPYDAMNPMGGGFDPYETGVIREPAPIEVDTSAIPKEVLDTYTNPRVPLVCASMPGPRLTAWLREFPVPTDRRDRRFVFCKGGIILMLKAKAAQLASSKPVELFPMQICTHFLMHNYCSRPNCLHEHHTEEQLRLLIAARHVALKALTKQERQHLVDDILEREKEGLARAEEERLARQKERENTWKASHPEYQDGAETGGAILADGEAPPVNPGPIFPNVDSTDAPVVSPAVQPASNPSEPVVKKPLNPNDIGVTDDDDDDDDDSSSSSSKSSSSSSSSYASSRSGSRDSKRRKEDDAEPQPQEEKEPEKKEEDVKEAQEAPPRVSKSRSPSGTKVSNEEVEEEKKEEESQHEDPSDGEEEHQEHEEEHEEDEDEDEHVEKEDEEEEKRGKKKPKAKKAAPKASKAKKAAPKKSKAKKVPAKKAKAAPKKSKK